MKKKIGLFGGTFDPIHFGHLNLAFELMEKNSLDEVWFIPAQVNPHKAHLPPLPFDHRFNMVKLATQHIPQFFVKDLEKNRPPPSYTIETVRAIIQEEVLNPQSRQFYLLMGEDSISNYTHWHSPEEIVRLVPLLIGSRTCQTKIEPLEGLIGEAIRKGLTSTRVFDISGTELRKRLTKGLYCEHLIPYPVLKYIELHDLYSQI